MDQQQRHTDNNVGGGGGGGGIGGHPVSMPPGGHQHQPPVGQFMPHMFAPMYPPPTMLNPNAFMGMPNMIGAAAAGAAAAAATTTPTPTTTTMRAADGGGPVGNNGGGGGGVQVPSAPAPGMFGISTTAPVMGAAPGAPLAPPPNSLLPETTHSATNVAMAAAAAAAAAAQGGGPGNASANQPTLLSPSHHGMMGGAVGTMMPLAPADTTGTTVAPAPGSMVGGGGGGGGGVPISSSSLSSSSNSNQAMMQTQVTAAGTPAGMVASPTVHALRGGNNMTKMMTSSSSKVSQLASVETTSSDITHHHATTLSQSSSSNKGSSSKRGSNTDMTPEEKAKLNRDRNREHARSTRLRKKAYVNKLKELVEGLHAERSEEQRKRRVAVQHLAEVQSVRRTVIRNFLSFHSQHESDPRKWMTILEEKFFFKQPVTPYRSFRRVEIEQECRKSRGVEAMVADSASMAVMVENIGSRSPRWMQIKREEFLAREEFLSRENPVARQQQKTSSSTVVPQNSKLQNAVSSLSSSSGSSTGNGSGGEEDRQDSHGQQHLSLRQDGGSLAQVDKSKVQQQQQQQQQQQGKKMGSARQQSNDFHDYHAPSLPDPKLDSGDGSMGSESPGESRNASHDASGRGRGRANPFCTDSSSGEEDKPRVSSSSKPGASKKRRIGGRTATGSNRAETKTSSSSSRTPQKSGLPPNIARSGGISHSIRSVVGGNDNSSNRSVNTRLNTAPAIPLPPFVGIGKRAPVGVVTTDGGCVPSAGRSKSNVGVTLHNSGGTGSGATRPLSSQVKGDDTTPSQTISSPAVIPSRESSSSKGSGSGSGTSKNSTTDALTTNPVGTTPTALVAVDDTTSLNSNNQFPQIQSYYHINEDDMLLTDDVLMCPFIFRSQDAVLCGALAECIMPGMLRAHFSARNKLLNLEMVYDAMGFMQQLERASGSEGAAQIVPNSLEMALSPNTDEARVITLAKPPFLIVSVNEAWTKVTKYTQMEVEGKEMSILNGKRTDLNAGKRVSKPIYDFVEVAKGRCACCVNVHYDRDGRDFLDFVCSYPLTNANNDITHLLHICKELPAIAPETDFSDSASNGFQ